MGLWDPFQMAELHGLEIGVTNYLLSVMILQVVNGLSDTQWSSSTYQDWVV